MKTKLYLSIFAGILFGIGMYLLYVFSLSEVALETAIISGILFTIILFPVLICIEKVVNRKYKKLEKDIVSPIFFKACGNFYLGNKVRNGNIYFCENGILFASLDTKPYAVEELLLSMVEKWQFDDLHMNIFTEEGRVYMITTPQAKEIVNALKEKKWIE